jgi:hypothetical protein
MHGTEVRRSSDGGSVLVFWNKAEGELAFMMSERWVAFTRNDEPADF